MGERPRTRDRDPVPKGSLLAIGAVVRTRREMLRLTQQALADLAGLTRSTVLGVERGRPAYGDTYRRIGGQLGLDDDWYRDPAHALDPGRRSHRQLVEITIAFAASDPGPEGRRLIARLGELYAVADGRAAAEEACKVALKMLEQQGAGGSA